MAVILIVDDQSAVRTALEVLFEVHNLPAVTAKSPSEALARIRRGDVALVIQDMNFSENTTSGEEGIALFRGIRALDPDMPILLLTAWSSLETAVMLVKEGAHDYLEKPWTDQKLIASVEALWHARVAVGAPVGTYAGQKRRDLAADLNDKYDVAGLVFASDAMFKVVSLAVQIAQADVPVLISGPNGAGKERIAEIVQANSRRKSKPFVKINAGALPENLIEAELFGAEAGAYTGLTKMRLGRFEAADQGTLFLDEVGNLSLAGQAKLLRVIQTGEFQRLGSSSSKRVDVRVISATNVDLRAAITNKMFREDLYFRLNVIEIRVPALSDRKDDIIPIANQALAQFAKENQSEVAYLSEGAKQALLAYHWPGNVRELQNRLFRASLLCQDHEIVESDLDLSPPVGAASAPSAPPPANASGLAREGTENEGERARIENALLQADGNVSKAAAELGLSRQALYRRMERLGLSLERRVKNERNS